MSAPTHETASRLPRALVRDVAWRAALVVVAALAVAFEVTAVLRLPLSAAAAAVVIAYALRGRRRDAVGTALLVTGGAFIAVVLSGVVLNLTPAGLSGPGWAIAVGAGELVVLALTARRRHRAPAAAEAASETPRGRIPLTTIGWVLVTGSVLTAALVWSTTSYDATHVAPVALSAQVDDGEAVVTVTAGAESGPFDLVLVEGARRTLLAEGISVGAGSETSTRFAFPELSRGTVQLVESGSTRPLRELVLDDSELPR